jgi:TonB family protein
MAKNHPEAVGDFPDARIAENDSPFDSLASFEEARAIWLHHAETRTAEPRILMNAAIFAPQFDPNLAERLLLQGRELEPKNRLWDILLADLYGKGIFTDGRFRPQTPPSTARHGFALRARAVVEATNNAVLAGLAGLRLAAQDVTILRTRTLEQIELGEKLLRKALALAPRDPQWEIYLHDLEAAKQELGKPEQAVSETSDAPPGTLIRRVSPEYPELAKRAGVAGLVQLRILVGVTGKVIVVRPLDSPPELQPAAAAAVKQWLFKPYMMNGTPVEMWKEVGVAFP